MRHGWDYPHCEEALSLVERLADRDGQADILNTIGLAHHHAGEYGRAVESYQRALELYRTQCSPYWESATLGHLGDTHHAAGDLPAARVAWGQALAILTELDHPRAEQVRDRLAALDGAVVTSPGQPQRPAKAGR